MKGLNRREQTVFDLDDVPDHQLLRIDLDRLPVANGRELVADGDAGLQRAELSLFRVVVDRSRKDDQRDAHEDRHALDPREFVLGIFVA